MKSPLRNAEALLLLSQQEFCKRSAKSPHISLISPAKHTNNLHAKRRDALNIRPRLKRLNGTAEDSFLRFGAKVNFLAANPQLKSGLLRVLEEVKRTRSKALSREKTYHFKALNKQQFFTSRPQNSPSFSGRCPSTEVLKVGAPTEEKHAGAKCSFIFLKWH